MDARVKPAHDPLDKRRRRQQWDAVRQSQEVKVPTLNLPVGGGKLKPYTTKPPRHFPAAKPPFNRIAYAAAHVVADPMADSDPWLDAAIDWERTVAFRRHLWSLGLGVAEAGLRSWKERRWIDIPELEV